MNAFHIHSYVQQIVVVDAKFNDYRCLEELVKLHAIRLTVTSTGAGGLRLAPSYPDALWLISVALPDMSGLDFLEMVRATQPRLRVLVIDDSYNAMRERHALRLSATRYLCKPIQSEWIAQWQENSRAELPASAETPDAVRLALRQSRPVRNR